MVVTQMLASGVEVKLPKSRTATQVQDAGQHLVIAIKPPLSNSKDPGFMWTAESMVTSLSMTSMQTPKDGSRSLLLSAKNLKWKKPTPS